MPHPPHLTYLYSLTSPSDLNPIMTAATVTLNNDLKNETERNITTSHRARVFFFEHKMHYNNGVCLSTFFCLFFITNFFFYKGWSMLVGGGIWEI